MINWCKMQFKDVIGQEEVKQHLRKLVRDNKLPHALLFSGPSGVGKLPLAVALAQYLACSHRESDSCGQCSNCLQWGRLQHPDLHFAYPVIKKGTEPPVADDYAAEWREMLHENPYFDIDDWYEKIGSDGKQGMIYEKESSEIMRKLSLKAFSGGKKVMIIWQPEKMNAVCANKLLKIIEEPPQDTLFILVSEQPEQLLPTILSRVQTVNIGRLSEDEIALALSERFPELASTTALDIAHLAGGSFTHALKNMQSNKLRNEMFDWWKLILRKAWMVGHKKDYGSLLVLKRWSTELNYDDESLRDENNKPIQHRSVIAVGREGQKAFLDYAIEQVRENYIRNYGMPELNYQTHDETAFSERFAPYIHNGNVEGLISELSTARRQIEQNGNPKMIFFDLCLKLILLIK